MYRWMFVVAWACTVASAAEQTVVQIGKADHSYRDLAIAGDYGQFVRAFAQKGVVFDAAKGDASRDWPFIHPGPVDTWAGGTVHPFKIRFQLSDAPRGRFVLRIGMVNTHYGVPPRYAIRIGEREGQFVLPAGAGDDSLSKPEAGKPHQIEIVVPASFFRQGDNEITLTCIEGSWVLYDYVSLVNDPDAELPKATIESVALAPTPFYVRSAGKLCREVDVTVQTKGAVSELSLTVVAGGETVKVPVRNLLAFGTVSEAVCVPDQEGPLQVTATATAGDDSKTVTAQLEPQRKWRIFVAPSAHTDIGYTDLQPRCVERHDQNIDLAMQLCDKYPDFRWNLEVSWQAENFLRLRSKPQIDKFLALSREGRIGVQGLYCNILTGLCSPEEACRWMRCSSRVGRQVGVTSPSAMISDVPTQEASLPMILANSGIRYFSSGINNVRATTFTSLYSKCPAWWEGPDGSRVLMMWVPGYAHASGWGLDQSVERARGAIVQSLRAQEGRKDYPYDAVFLHGAVSDNCPLNANLAEVAKAWNERYAYPQVILCRNAEFFEYVEKKWGDKLPVIRGSSGTYWEDGAGSSARETTLCRNAHESVGSAEKYFALANSFDASAGYPAVDIESAWRNCLLYDEHTWGAHCSISQPDSAFTKDQWKIKAQFAIDADAQSRRLLESGSSLLASRVQTPGRSIVVFNPTSWPRTDVLQLPAGSALPNAQVPACQVGQTTYVLVKDVPACGYRTLPVDDKAQCPQAQTVEGNTIESNRYRVTFDAAAGAIVSIVDKESNRELVDAKAEYRLNQYLYVSGGRRSGNEEALPDPKLIKVQSSEGAKLTKTKLGTLGEMMTITCSAPMTPAIMSTVTVWNDVPRIDIASELEKTQTYEKEAVYFAFPFAAESPTIRYEIPAGVVNSNTDMLPGACLDWFTVQHFVEIEDKGGAIAWASPDAPLVCFQDINRGKWQTSLPMKNGHVYAYLMNNYWFTNYLAGQGGKFRFRFSITSRAAASNVESARFGWGVSNPLSAVTVDANPSGTLPANEASLISIDEPNVLLVGVHKPDEGKGLVARLWEISGKDTVAHLKINGAAVTKASACNLVDDAKEPLEIADGKAVVPIRHSGLATVRLE